MIDKHYKLILGVMFTVMTLVLFASIAYGLPNVKEGREVYITGEINKSVYDTIKVLKTLDRDKGDIRIYLDSFGGSVFYGMSLANTIRSLKNDVQIVVMRGAYSMAATLTVCGTKGKRAMYENAELFIHDCNINFMGVLSTEDMKEVLEMMEKVNEEFYVLYAERTTAPYYLIKEWCQEETDLSSESCLAFGFVDEVIEFRND